MAPLAEAFVRLRPQLDARDVERATDQGIAKARPDRAGRRLGIGLSKSVGDGMRVGLGGPIRGALGTVTAAFAGAKIASFFGDSIAKAGTFDKTLRMIGQTTGEVGPRLNQLRELAVKFGAETTFSAKDAGDAMLELARGGLTSAQIKAGALGSTLTLASAGGLDLGESASFMVQGLNTFGLAAKDATRVAAALAGGANASTASVQSMGEALSQVGPGAKNAGLSIQDTTAVLAAFSNKGIQGSDAGTSLKTMLARLVPQTDAASGAMRDLGLKFTDAQGKFLPITKIAEQLKTRLSGLSQEQRTTALSTIFGSDATRAATVLMGEGAAGITKYIKATSDQKAATDLAKVGTEGYAGAMEKFKGSVETAQISLGTKLLPLATKFLNFVSETAIPKMTELGGWISRNKDIFLALGAAIAAVKIGQFINFAIGAAKAARAWMIAQGSLNAVLLANPLGLVLVGVAALTAGLVLAYTRSETFRKIVNGAFHAVAAAALWMAEQVVVGAAHAFEWVPGLGPKLHEAAGHFLNFKNQVNAALSGTEKEHIALVGVKMTPAMKAMVDWQDKNRFVSSQIPVARARGGRVFGPGSATSDSVPALLSNGEYVVKAASVRKYGPTLFEALNAGRFAAGGPVGVNVRTRFDDPRAFAGVANVLNRSLDGFAARFGAKVGSAIASTAMGAVGNLGTPGNVSGNAAIVQALAASQYGWTGPQWAALHRLVMKESGFRNTAQNPTSTAYGMFQFLNGTWGTVGGHKTADPRLQALYGLKYIARSYGSPLKALAFHNRNNYYDQGGLLSGPGEFAKRTQRPERVLSPDQTQAFERLVSVLERGGGGGHVTYQVNHVPGYSTIRDLEEADRRRAMRANIGRRH